MPKVATILTLTDDVRIEFEREVRARGYGDLVGLSAWLRERGYNASKSAVGRFTQALKANDRTLQSLHKTIDPALTDGQRQRALELLLELGALRVREAAILDRLRAAGIDSESGLSRITSAP